MLYFANTVSSREWHGRSMAYAARKAFLQMRMMEDAIVIARLTRAHNKFAYMVETGTMTPKEAQKHLTRVKQTLRKRKIIDPRTGKMDLSHNPLTVEEDIFVATNKDSNADVKIMQGDLTIGNINDFLMIQQKVFTALKVPKAYLANEDQTKARAVITAQDIQFARSVRRVQYVLQVGLQQLLTLQLKLKGIPLEPFSVALPLISAVDELRKWQAEQLKVLTARSMKETFWPTDEWVAGHFFNMTPDEVQLFLKGRVIPDKYNGLYVPPKPVTNITKPTSAAEGLSERGDAPGPDPLGDPR